jgi:hypothetical protein
MTRPDLRVGNFPAFQAMGSRRATRRLTGR